MIVKFNLHNAETYRYMELLSIVEGYENKNILTCAITYEDAKAEILKRKDLLEGHFKN